MNKYSPSVQSAKAGVDFATLLALIFITMKLLDKIDWSWWWVLSPIWITVAIVAAYLLILLIVALIVHLIRKRYVKKRRAKYLKRREVFEAARGIFERKKGTNFMSEKQMRVFVFVVTAWLVLDTLADVIRWVR